MADITGKFKKTKGINYTTLLKKQQKHIFEKAENIRDKLKQIELAEIGNIDTFLIKLNRTLDTNVFSPESLAEITEVLQSRAPIEELRKALNRLTGQLDELVELDHITMEPINVTLTLTIKAIENIIRNIEQYGTLARADDDFVGKYGEGSKFNTSHIPELRKVISDIRGLRLASEISTAFGRKITVKEFKEGIEQYRRSNGTYNIEVLKTKDLSGLQDGKILSVLEIRTKSDHESKSSFQKLIGQARVRALGGKSKKEETERVKKLLAEIRQIGPENLTGSKTIKEVLHSQIKDTLKGKTVTKYKAKSNKKSKVNAPLPRANNKLKSKGSRVQLQARNIAALLGSTSKTKKDTSKVETNDGSLQKELNKLKRLINARLPAEVRRNMGRPALINRSGIFSNSVQLLNLRDTGATVTGEYTYTLSGGGTSKNKQGVYSTFENLGTKQWPVGYNPKPLITKSIRNLAQADLGKRFTLRRV
jgi:hypothetical protein